MSIVAVVLSWREVDLTTRCVDSLLAEPLIDEVVVVDNESSGALHALESRAQGRVRLIELQENRGFAGGVNEGLRLALARGASAVLCINNDAKLEPGTVAAMQLVADADPAVGIVGPTIVDQHGRIIADGGKVLRSRMEVDERAGASANFVTWACVLVPAPVLDRVGLLDDRFFMYWEDVDFSFRLTSAGLRLAVVPERVRHDVSSSHEGAGLGIIDLYSALSLGVFASKYRSYLPSVVLNLVARAIKRVIGGRTRQARGVLRAARRGFRTRDAAWTFRAELQRYIG